jgi:hypothetical protein
MPASHSPAVVLLSVSAESVSSTTARQPDLATAEAVLLCLNEHDIAATWCSRSPVASKLTSMIMDGSSRQEMAILAAADGRPVFAEDLRREVLRARAGGWPLSSIFVAGNLPTEHQDLLVKYGITAVYPLATGEGKPAATSTKLWRASRWLLPMQAHASQLPQKLRWGLWRMPAAVSLDQEGAWRVRHAIDRAVATVGMVHVHVDLATTVGRRRIQDDVESVLRQIASHAGRGRLRTQTMSATVAGLSRSRTQAPACSILRKRAA